MSDDLFELGERIADLAARINIATFDMLTLVADFDRREGWARQLRVVRRMARLAPPDAPWPPRERTCGSLMRWRDCLSRPRL